MRKYTRRRGFWGNLYDNLRVLRYEYLPTRMPKMQRDCRKAINILARHGLAIDQLRCHPVTAVHIENMGLTVAQVIKGSFPEMQFDLSRFERSRMYNGIRLVTDINRPIPKKLQKMLDTPY